MPVLIAIALKSLLIAGITLGLLALMQRRSAAERSTVAHIGLFALALLAFAPLVLPSWSVEAPALLGHAAAQPTVVQPVTRDIGARIAPVAVQALPARSAAAPVRLSSISSPAVATAAYAIPAAILLFITFLALARLIALRARADVLVDGHWLSALARAQRRMGFKHGTALLTSNELSSPVSWGLVRPVILLNSRAVEASNEAEAIIAHELAHVARMDWAKLLLARVATALFWFNPLVWMLAREAHQLREETADDTVLAADIPDTDYAQLLVGVARHECPGLLLGAHGVAPSKNSLARRVARVLDNGLPRRPTARPFAAGVFTGAILIAAPLAALTLAPAKPTSAGKPALTAGSNNSAAAGPRSPYYSPTDDPADLPSILARGVSTSVKNVAAAFAPQSNADETFSAVAPNGASVTSANGMTVTRSPNGASVTVYPPDANGRRRVVSRAPNGATVVSYVDANDTSDATLEHRHNQNDSVEQIVAMKALGITPDYAAAIRAASPALRDADTDELVQLRSVGATPDYIRGLAALGFTRADAEDLAQARVAGVTANYIRSLMTAGYRGKLDDYAEMRAAGVEPGDVAQAARSHRGRLTSDTIIEIKTGGSDPPDPPEPPNPPQSDEGN